MSPTINSLPESLNRRLNLYSVTAAAAGVGMLALSQPATGTIVITNKTIPIPLCNLNSPCPVTIDFNNDGIADVQFLLTYYPEHSFYFANLNAQALGAGAGVMAPPNGANEPYASCLLRGAKIGGSAKFATLAMMERSSGHAYATTSHPRHLYGKWDSNQPNRFLGVKFKFGGKTHYGWVRVTVKTNTSQISATVTEYGYETVANKRVSAGLPGAASVRPPSKSVPAVASLGALALGAEGMEVWRREEEVITFN